MLVAGIATPALADSARPTNYRSEVTEIVPPSVGISVRVVGGDAFLQITAQPGTAVEVSGYQGEPYLRFRPDGEVVVNRNSPTYWVNQDRFGQAGVPPTASVDATPVWDRVATQGSYGWHDHRIHWMAPIPPPGVTQGEITTIQEWIVPVVVDGEESEIRGRLQWLPSVSPLPWLSVAALAIVVIIWTKAARSGLIIGAGIAAVIGLSQALGSPLGPGGELLAWVPPILSLVGASAAIIFPRRRLPSLTVSGMLLAVWAAIRLPSLWMPVLPSELPTVFERAGIALAAGTALAALVHSYRSVVQPSS
jgi:hypothetical protein